MARFEVRDLYDPSGLMSGPGSKYYVHDKEHPSWESSKTFRLKQKAQRYAAKLEKQASKEKNPAHGLPVGRYITVKAIRRKNGRVDLYRA